MFLFPAATAESLQEPLLPVCGPRPAEYTTTGLEVHINTPVHTHTHGQVNVTSRLCVRGAELIEAATVKAVRARLEVEKTSMDLLKRQ